MNQPEIKRDLPGGGFLKLQKIGNSFRLVPNANGKNSQDTFTPQEAVEAMAHIVTVFINADLSGAPGAQQMGEESMGFMQDAVNAFPELAERYRFMADDKPCAEVN